jgi:hypothetical protein
MVFEMSTVFGLIRITGSRTANVGWPTVGVKRTGPECAGLLAQR